MPPENRNAEQAAGQTELQWWQGLLRCTNVNLGFRCQKHRGHGGPHHRGGGWHPVFVNDWARQWEEALVSSGQVPQGFNVSSAVSDKQRVKEALWRIKSLTRKGRVANFRLLIIDSELDLLAGALNVEDFK